MCGSRPLFGRVTSDYASSNNLTLRANFTPAESLAYSTTPPDFLATVLNIGAPDIPTSDATLDLRVQASNPNEDARLSWKQPVVITQCSMWEPYIPYQNDTDFSKTIPTDSLTTLVNFTSTSNELFQIVLNDSLLRPIYEEDVGNPSAPQLLTFLDIQSDVPFPVSAASLMVNGVTVTNSTFTALSQLCLSNATWTTLPSSNIDALSNKSGISHPNSSRPDTIRPCGCNESIYTSDT